MAYITAIDSSTLSNQNISSAVLTHAYTCTTRVRKVYVAIELQEIVGAGEYVAYATVQRGGTGSVYRLGSEAIITSGGVTAIAFQAMPIILNVDDVLKTYVVGVVTDTTTPDITTRLWEESAADAGIDAAGVTAAVWDAARSGHATDGTFGDTAEWAGSVDEAAIAAAVLDALEGSPITAICINPERSEESDYDNLRRNPADCC